MAPPTIDTATLRIRIFSRRLQQSAALCGLGFPFADWDFPSRIRISLRGLGFPFADRDFPSRIGISRSHRARHTTDIFAKKNATRASIHFWLPGAERSSSTGSSVSAMCGVRAVFRIADSQLPTVTAVMLHVHSESHHPRRTLSIDITVPYLSASPMASPYLIYRHRRQHRRTLSNGIADGIAVPYLSASPTASPTASPYLIYRHRSGALPTVCSTRRRPVLYTRLPAAYEYPVHIKTVRP